MNVNSMYWMQYSIDISKKVSPSLLQVGTVLVSEQNKLLCSAYSGETCNESWYFVLLRKIQKLKISHAQSIYLTINTISKDCSFDLIKLLKRISINEIYVGLPDPTLTCYWDNDPAIVFDCVYRYPDKLQREILEQNYQFFSESKQHIKYSPYYSENRISNLVIEKLKLRGFVISKDELNTNKSKSAIASILCDRYGIEYSEANSIVSGVISEAFSSKYASYNYSDDTRSLDVDWKENFISVYKRSSEKNMSAINILNVGVGGGHEAIALFSNCTHVTFVDIVQSSLERIKEHSPLSKIIVSSAGSLFSIPDNSYDLYVSLRTYNSSFFDIKEAISEAHRVLKTDAVIIISVANGFLCSEKHGIVPGLIIPGTEFVDIYRGINTSKLIHNEFIRLGFKNIQLIPTNTEIYLSAIAA